MNYSEIKEVKTFCENLFSEPSWREVIENVISESDDFEINNVRFIKESEILDILAEELASDHYILGCFASRAISNATGWPEALIKAAQAGEQYEAIGAGMDEDEIYNLAKEYASTDGYGHHFNHWDFSEESININGIEYLVFDNH